jgi:probable rRNA maturation factor
VNQAVLLVRNRQRCRGIDGRYLQRIIRDLLKEDLGFETFEIGIHLIGETAMVFANEGYLRHGGCTDVITFDYNETKQPACLRGDLLVCIPEAVRQAERFRATWQKEVVRYIVHGMLHLCGYDDRRASERRRMKRKENKILGRLARQFDLKAVSASGRKPALLR